MSTDTAFARLGVPPELSSALKAMRFTEPFEIQALTVPDALAGRDILGRAPTGSGKTLAFGLPLLARLSRARPGHPTGLILAPTRELAEQIRRELEPLATSVGRSTLAVYGGKRLDQQVKALARGIDLLVACPGRLLDLIDQRKVSLDSVEVAVVDEADRMADMGFLPDVSKIMGLTPGNRQTMLYSATLDNDVQVLIDTYQTNPVEHAVTDVEPDLSLLTHRFIQVPKRERIWLAADLITDHGTSIIFVRTRHGVDRLARQLQQHGVKAAYIHGGRSQSQRDRALDLFTSGKVRALVATDVAARGIHVDGVECVIHYDPPAEDKDYIHRSGRTARAGASGVVVSLLDRPQVPSSRKMQKKLGIRVELEPTPERVHHLPSVTSPPRPTRSSRPRAAAPSSSRNGSKAGAESRSARKAPAVISAGDRRSEEEVTPTRRPVQRTSMKRPGKATAGSGGSKTSAGGPKTKAGGKSTGKRRSVKPQSKRSGKPRPKNRKNKPKGGGRR